MNKKGLVTEQDRLIIHDVEKQIDSVLQKMEVIFVEGFIVSTEDL